MRKRDERPFAGVSTNFEREPQSDTPCKDRVSVLKINDINDILFLERLIGAVQIVGC
jgi:hypothetical protein